jgi:AraC family transcriptional regulator
MADVVRMSPYHFGRLFKQSTGLAPHQYHLRLRVVKAKQLLANERLSIAEISQRLGFASHSHFSTVFRKQVGATPTEYRRNPPEKPPQAGNLVDFLLLAL